MRRSSPNYTPAPTYAAYAAAAGYTPASYGTPAAESQPRASFDVHLGPEATASAAKAAIEHDPLEPVNIGPGGTFGMGRCPIFLILRTITLPRPIRSPLSSLLQTSLS